MMKAIGLWAALLVGCVNDQPRYLRVEMRFGPLDNCVPGDGRCGWWADTWQRGNGDPPGVFTTRIREEPVPGESPLALTDALVSLDPNSVCALKSPPTCRSDGDCYAEFVQDVLGYCMVHVIASSDDLKIHSCWFFGTYPANGPTLEERDANQALVDQYGCAGGW